MTVNKQSPWFLVLMAVTGLIVFGIVLLMQPRDWTERMIKGQNDFMQLYAGARLNGTSELYSREANLKIQAEIGGVQSDAMAHHSRLPFYSFLLRPLAFLPYRTAYYIFEGISLLAFFLFLWMFVPGCRELAAFASLSIPLYATIENGQDSTIVVMFAGLSIFLARKNLEFWSGFALSFCAIKFHLFLLIPVIILIKRRWSILWGAVASGAILLAVSFARAGMDWPRVYIEAMKDSDLHPHPELMPNIHALSAMLSGATDVGVELILSIAVCVAVVYVATKVADYELVFAFALIGSMLLSFHSYTQDCVVLLLSLAIILKKPFSKTARGLTELAACPIPYFCLFAGAPFNLAMPGLLLGILGAAAVQAARSPSHA